MVKVVINPSCSGSIKEFIKHLPHNFETSGQTLADARNIIKVFDVDGMKLNVKSFKKPHIINQFIYATFRDSKAKRSYEYAHRLEERGINTPTPIAYLENNKGFLLKTSAYISIQENVDGLLRELYYGTLEQHRELICQFAKFTGDLHNKQILHLDYSSGNIMYKKDQNGEFMFYLVDLNRMKFDKYVDIDTACKNFKRLWGNEEMITLFAQEYSKVRGFDVELCIKKTFMYRTRFWRYFNTKYPDARPFEEKK